MRQPLSELEERLLAEATWRLVESEFSGRVALAFTTGSPGPSD